SSRHLAILIQHSLFIGEAWIIALAPNTYPKRKQGGGTAQTGCPVRYDIPGPQSGTGHVRTCRPAPRHPRRPGRRRPATGLRRLARRARRAGPGRVHPPPVRYRPTAADVAALAIAPRPGPAIAARLAGPLWPRHHGATRPAP